MKLELLSPAKNYEQGCEAVNHGADAVYIGAPCFGARAAAGNRLDDIERLARYAHVYGAKVFVTVNTLLFDSEIEEAADMIHQLYNAGADAAIIQDLGLLECDLPPIELHASTQTHNASTERIKFMEQVGFSRVILARETSLAQMEEIRRSTTVELEAFVQGALCVSYSGQCYMSQYLSGTSGNRGRCGQPCRSAYDLCDSEGAVLRKNEHLLSLKDFSAARHLRQMAEAGITSFKIEGRLKDMNYVKNVTAYYRQLLDDIIDSEADQGLVRASSGRCRFFFVPDLEKTFNRGFTDYFLSGRQPMATITTQKSLGKKVGTIIRAKDCTLTLKTRETVVPGDGLCFFNSRGVLEGFLVNQVQGAVIRPNRMPQDIPAGAEIWRNNDQTFEKQLQGNSAIRKIPVRLRLTETAEGIRLLLTDEEGHEAAAETVCPKEPAHQPARALQQTERQLSKLGDTPFEAAEIRAECARPYFLAAALLNDLRRRATTMLEERRIAAHLAQRGAAPTLAQRRDNRTPYYQTALDYRANVVNAKAELFYQRHGATIAEHGVEETHKYDGKALMTTKYCLRYELGMCLRQTATTNNREPKPPTGPLYLRNNKNRFLLEFDCKQCLMRVIALTAQPQTD